MTARSGELNPARSSSRSFSLRADTRNRVISNAENTTRCNGHAHVRERFRIDDSADTDLLFIDKTYEPSEDFFFLPSKILTASFHSFKLAQILEDFTILRLPDPLWSRSFGITGPGSVELLRRLIADPLIERFLTRGEDRTTNGFCVNIMA